MKSSARKVELASAADLFSTEQERQDAKLEKVQNIPLSELYPFPDHPFSVRDDDSMKETVESVKEYGVLMPAIARPREGGGYELVAGHRRKHACELAGLDTMPVIVRDLDRDTAIIFMVDSNLQRENILPSERAKAYKMKLDAIKRRAGRPTVEHGENSPKISANFRSDDMTNAGTITAEIAKAHAESEFEKYRIIQDRLYESDYDRFLAMEQGAASDEDGQSGQGMTLL